MLRLIWLLRTLLSGEVWALPTVLFLLTGSQWHWVAERMGISQDALHDWLHGLCPCGAFDE